MNEEELNEEMMEEDDDVILRCPNCGYIYDTANPPMDSKGRVIVDINDYVLLSDPSKIQCPNCGRRVEFEVLSEEEYKRIIAYREKKEKERESRKARAMRYNNKQYNKALKKMNKELIEELLDGEHNPKRFSKIYFHMSYQLAQKYKEKLDLDMMQVRDVSLKAADKILKVYKVQEKSEDLIEKYEEDISQDEVYLNTLKTTVEEAKIFEEETPDIEFDHEDYVENYKEKFGDVSIEDVYEQEKKIRIEKIRLKDKTEAHESRMKEKERQVEKETEKAIDEYNKSIDNKK